MRLINGKSFNEESRGGSKESNIRLVPFLIQMASLLLDGLPVSSSQRRMFEGQMIQFLKNEPKKENSGRHGAVDGPEYFLLLSLLLFSPAQWKSTKFEIFKRILAASLPPTPEVSTSEGDIEMSEDIDVSVLWNESRSNLLMFGIVDELQACLKGPSKEPAEKPILEEGDLSHLPNAEWIVALNLTIRVAPFNLSEDLVVRVGEWEEELLPISSLEELADERGLLPFILSEHLTMQSFLKSLPRPFTQK